MSESLFELIHFLKQLTALLQQDMSSATANIIKSAVCRTTGTYTHEETGVKLFLSSAVFLVHLGLLMLADNANISQVPATAIPILLPRAISPTST